MKLYRFVFSILFLPSYLLAHDGRPIFVEISEIDDQAMIYDVKIKTPDSISFFPGIGSFKGCHYATGQEKSAGAGFSTLEKQLVCSESIQGKMINLAFPGPNPSLATLLRVSLSDGSVYTKLLSPGDRAWLIPRTETLSGISREYSYLGLKHILLGYDHLLFVLCLFSIVMLREKNKWRTLFITITGFTLAHSVTLAFSVLDLITLPNQLVEALIALSIVFLALELVSRPEKSLTFSYPAFVAVGFGLLHGFGFASVLKVIGLPKSELLLGLIFFNLGVEVGQIFFIVMIVAITFVLSRVSDFSKQQSAVIGYVAGVWSAYWVIERVSGFW